MELSAATIFSVETASAVVLTLLFLASCVLLRRTIALTIWLVIAVDALAIAFRPDDYNSDTWAYVRYVDLLHGTSGLELLAATKFEPIHLVLASMSGSFRIWLLLESAAFLISLAWFVRKTNRFEVQAIVIGAALPLLSSSVRFSVASILVAAAIASAGTSLRSRIFVSILGISAHVSMAVAGFWRGRRWQLAVLAIVAFAASALVAEELLDRAGAGIDSDAHSTGLRAVVPIIVLVAYLGTVAREYRRERLLTDALVTVALAIGTAWFPLLNRWLILWLMLIAVESEGVLAEAINNRLCEAVVATSLFAMLAISFLWSTAQHVKAGDW